MPRSSPSRKVVARIAEDMSCDIQAGMLPAGSTLPSVRKLASERKISAFSAAEIYNSLVATGLIEARPGRGYFVINRRKRSTPLAPSRIFPGDSNWDRRLEASALPIEVDAGAGWLPSDWLYEAGLRSALRAVARGPRLQPEGYGDPRGLAELRAHLTVLLDARRIDAREDQIVLTQGASQALELIVRTCLAPADTVLVEDPGYPLLFELLRHRGVRLLAVPRTERGPDVDAMAKLLQRRTVRCFFTNTTYHNPTGTTTSAACAHRVLELAGKHDFTVVEDDIFCDLTTQPVSSLAALDDLRRVIYLSSFSKTIAPSLRAGYLVATPAMAQKLAREKVMSSLGTSELLERVLLQVLTHGHYRRHLKSLRERLAAAHLRVHSELAARGVESEFRTDAGLFLWARLPSSAPAAKLWRMALNHGVLLAPGELFRPDGQASRHWRFNVAHCLRPELFAFVDRLKSIRA